MKKIIALVLVAAMMFSMMAIPALANAEHPDFNRETLRGIVAGQISSTLGWGAEALLDNDAIKDFAKEAVKGLLDVSQLAGLAGPALGDLIEGAVSGAIGTDIPDFIDIGGIINDVLGSDIINAVLTHRIVVTVIDRTIDNLFEEIDLMPFADLIFDAMIDDFTDQIWNNGNPTSGTVFGLQTGHWNTTGGWNTTRIGITLGLNVVLNAGGALLSGDFGAFIDIDDIDPADLLAIFDINILLNAVAGAVIDTAREEIELFIAPYIALVRAEVERLKDQIGEAIELAKAEAKAEIINALNKAFDLKLSVYEELEAVEAAIIAYIRDSRDYIAANKSEIIGSLRDLKLIINTVDKYTCLDLGKVNAILDKLLDCLAEELEEEEPPVIEEPTLTDATAGFVSIIETSKNSRIWVLTFDVEKVYSDGSSEIIRYSINLNGNNANLDCKYIFESGHDLEGYTLVYDIKGNGSNIKAFKLVK